MSTITERKRQMRYQYAASSLQKENRRCWLITDQRTTVRISKHLSTCLQAELSVILSAASSGSFNTAKSNCHRVGVLLQLWIGLYVIWAFKKRHCAA